MNFLNYFDHIYCINLLRRQDRWEESIANFSKLNIVDRVERIDGVDGKFLYPNVIGRSKRYVGIFGCNHSHLNIINDAISKKYENILILEDDIQFQDDFLNLFNQFSDQIDNKWDLLYLGGNYRIIKNKLTPNILQLGKVFTTHSYAISKNTYQILKEGIEGSIKNYTDNKRLDVIDVIISNLIQNNKLLCYGFYPKLTWQRESYSDLRYAIKDYKILRK